MKGSEVDTTLSVLLLLAAAALAKEMQPKTNGYTREGSSAGLEFSDVMYASIRNAGDVKQRTQSTQPGSVVEHKSEFFDSDTSFEIVRGSDVLSKVPVIDGHNNFIFSVRKHQSNKMKKFNLRRNISIDSAWEGCNSCRTDLPKLRSGRVGAVFWSIWLPCSFQDGDSVSFTLEQIDSLLRMFRKYRRSFRFVTNSVQISSALKEGRIASLIGIEGAHAIDSRLALLRQFAKLGVRFMSLSSKCNVPWADSTAEEYTKIHRTHDGLSEFGEIVIQEMNRLGMMVDLVHSSSKTMLDIMRISKAPVIISHSGARALCHNTLYVQDEVLRKLKENNGIIMVTAHNLCKRENSTLEDVVEHINYIRKLIGVDHVGIGSDFDGMEYSPRGLDSPADFPRLFDRLFAGTEGEPAWTAADLKKLAGENVHRVMAAVEAVKNSMKDVKPSNDRLHDDLRLTKTCFTPWDDEYFHHLGDVCLCNI